MIDEMEEVLGNLLKENQPQDYIRIIEEENDKLYEQIEELTNNWNELEEWLKSVVEYETLHKGNYMTVRGEWGQEVLDKMKEIKENKNV